MHNHRTLWAQDPEIGAWTIHREVPKA